MSTKDLLKDDNNPNNIISNQPNIPLDKILPNNQNLKNDMMKFKDEVLRELKMLKKQVDENHEFTTTLMNDKFKKYDNKLSSCSDRISEITSKIKSNDDTVKEIKTLLDFKNKIRDSMITMDIKVNNIDRETKNNIFRIDNILSDTVLYPGILGKASKFKTFHQMIDYILAQTSQNLTYREKNNLDVNQVKKKISSIEVNFQNLKDNIGKEINSLLNKKLEESDQKLKSMILEYDERLKTSKAENADYIKDIQDTVKKFKEELKEFEIIKRDLTEEIKGEGRKLKEENDQTQNIFRGYKKEFNLMKDRFTQLSEFIKDVRFRLNLGQEVKRKEYYNISSKIDFSKKQKVVNENYLNMYNTKYQNDNDIPDFLQNHYSPNSIALRSSIINNELENKKTGNYSAGNKKIKNKGRNSALILRKVGRNPEINSKDNKTSKTDKISYELLLDENENDKNNKSIGKDEQEEEEGKHFPVKNKNNENNIKRRKNNNIKIKEIIKRRHTTNIRSFPLENFRQVENKNKALNTYFRKESVIQEILEDSNINENKKNMEKNYENYNTPSIIKLTPNNNTREIFHIQINDKSKSRNGYKILKKNIIKRDSLNEPSKFLLNFTDKTPNSKILNGLNNKDNPNIKNISLSSERINILSNTHFDENHKTITQKSKFTIVNDNNVIESKKNSKIYFTKKPTVKSLSRIQSSSTPKYPNISNNRPSLKSSNSLNNINKIDSLDKKSIYIPKLNSNKTISEEDKTNNTNRKNKGFYYNSMNNIYNSNRLQSHLSPNVKILKHSVENFNDNNIEANDLTGMINNLQKYINGYNANYINKKDIKNEIKKMPKNSEYFKLKKIINRNYYNNMNNDKKTQKNKANLIEIGFNEIK